MLSEFLQKAISQNADRLEIELGGAKDHQTAATIYFATQAGIRLKQVRITLREGEAIAESGALHFMLGQIQMESKIGGVSGFGIRLRRLRSSS
jgi:uncharacterized protein (AIM24 family)